MLFYEYNKKILKTNRIHHNLFQSNKDMDLITLLFLARLILKQNNIPLNWT